jgi:hypothetical protein
MIINKASYQLHGGLTVSLVPRIFLRRKQTINIGHKKGLRPLVRRRPGEVTMSYYDAKSRQLFITKELAPEIRELKLNEGIALHLATTGIDVNAFYKANLQEDSEFNELLDTIRDKKKK